MILTARQYILWTPCFSDRQRQYEKRAQRRTIRGLHSAIGEGKLDEVGQLLTPDIDVNFHYNQQSALQIAVLKGFLDICELLINHGADVNKQNAEGNTLLNMAVWRGHTAIVALLAKHGADLDVSNNHGSTALATAAYKSVLDNVIAWELSIFHDYYYHYFFFQV